MSSPVEHVYFVWGSLHGKTLPIGWGVEVLQHGREVYRRERGSRKFVLVATLKPVQAAQIEEEPSCPALCNAATSTPSLSDASENVNTTMTHGE